MISLSNYLEGGKTGGKGPIAWVVHTDELKKSTKKHGEKDIENRKKAPSNS